MGMAAADCGQGQPDRHVAEGRYDQMATIDAFVERNRQRADAAAEANAAVADPSVKLGIELGQNGDGQPEILDAAAQDIAFRFVNIIEHVPCGIAGNRRTATTREPAKTGKQHRRFFDRNVEIRLVTPAIAMADDEATPDRSLSR